jgi:hypothetical protein
LQVVGRQSLDQRFKLSFHDKGQVVRGETDAVIREAVLGEIVGTDLFVSFPRPDLLTAGCLHLAAFLFPFSFKETGR